MSESGPEPIAEVKWREPEWKSVYDWTAIAAMLRAKPLEWANVFEHDRTSIANAVRQGGVAPVHPALGFEVRTRNNTREKVRTCDLYMRWNPQRVDGLRQAIMDSRGEE